MDSYSHCDNSIVYIIENIPGPFENSQEYIILMDNMNSQISRHCSCRGKCNGNDCECISQSGGLNYTSKEDSYVINKNKLNGENCYPILECNSLCECNLNCGNRVVLKGPIQGLFIDNCKNKGLGLFTSEPILSGLFICEYAGEVITMSQALQRHKENTQNSKMNYIFCLNEHSNEQITRTIIDPSHFGNIGRYINHSCEPNCQITPVRVDSPVPKLAIFSRLDIESGAEITFDYGSFSLSDIEEEEGTRRKPCLCCSKNCRGLMAFQTYL